MAAIEFAGTVAGDGIRCRGSARQGQPANKSTEDFRPRRDLSTGEKSDNLSAGMGFFVGGNEKRASMGQLIIRPMLANLSAPRRIPFSTRSTFSSRS